MMANLEFDDEIYALMEAFNKSPGAVTRRARIIEALELEPGAHVLDVGSGPGHQAYEIAQALAPTGRVKGVDSAEHSADVARKRCAGLSNVEFVVGDAYELPDHDGTFDATMSSQVFEYLEDVPRALAEMYRVLKPGGRLLIHGTAWSALIWHSKDHDRMTQILDVWDRHLADPNLPETLAKRIGEAGFINTKIEPIVHIETTYDPSSMSGILMKFIEGYVVSQGVPESVAGAWAQELRDLGASGDYFFSSNEYVFTATKT